MELNLYRIAYPVTSLGPDSRIVIWVAGCRKRCGGCISPEMQEPSSGRMIKVKFLLKHLLKINHVVDGITISGGEPFEQAEALTALLKEISKNRPEWNIMVYSGYELLEVFGKYNRSFNIFKYIDVLIDGEYQKDVPSEHPLTGSGNQKIYYLTKRGRKMKKQIDTLSYNRINLGVGSENDYMLIGVVNAFTRHTIHKGLGLNGKELYICSNM